MLQIAIKLLVQRFGLLQVLVKKKTIIYLQRRVFLGHICICNVSYQSPSPNPAKMGALSTRYDLYKVLRNIFL